MKEVNKMARIVWSGFDPCEVKMDDNGVEYTQPYFNSNVESQKYSFYTESGENITIGGKVYETYKEEWTDFESYDQFDEWDFEERK